MFINRFFKDTVILLAIVSLLFFNLASWHLGFLNWVLFLAILVRAVPGAYDVLIKFFNLSGKGLRIKILAVFLVLMILSSALGLFILIYELNALSYSLAVLFTGLLFSCFKIWTSQIEIENLPEMYNPQMQVLDEMPKPIFTVIFFLILVAYGLVLLAQGRSDWHIFSPWQVINNNFVSVFLLVAFISGLLVFSRLKAKVILFLLIVFTFLLHSYLPLSHEFFYGADGWRHLAIENKLLAGSPLTAVPLSESPHNFIRALDPGRLAYGQFWGLQLLLAKLLNFDLLKLNIWLLPILWSVLLPILLFEIGRALCFNKKESLFLAWLSFLPFALQASGSFTLPANLGFLWWLLLVLLLLKRFNNPRREQALFLYIMAAASLFSYSLYFIIFILSWLTAEALRKKIPPVFLILPSICVLPAIELLAGYSIIPKQLNWLAQLKQVIGNFTGWYLATGPRPHDIATGNIILNQTLTYAFVVNFLTGSLYWLVAFMVIFYLLAGAGVFVALKQKTSIYNWAICVFGSLLGGYIISRYFLSGEKILTRRLDVILAFGFLLFFVFALKFLYAKFKERGKYLSLLLVTIVLFFSLVGTAIYSLGPDTETISEEEYKAMQYVWQNEAEVKVNSYCVLADTYPLLTLEAISAQQIVGGGFPINENFAQPERVNLYNQMLSRADEELFKQAKMMTGATDCWLVAPSSKLIKTEFIKDNYEDFKIFGKIIVWRFKN